MIRCLPIGICSWDYDIQGEGHHAHLGFRSMSEQGELVIDQVRHEVVKPSAFIGEWCLMGPEGQVFSATKQGIFSRTFDLHGSEGSFNLRALSAFGRTMVVEGSQTDFQIVPDHAFTRRASIQGDLKDFRLVAFTFWLTVIMWRRASRSNSGGGS